MDQGSGTGGSVLAAPQHSPVHGVPERLEFTVIGPAANEAARPEDMCKILERPILLPAKVAEQLSCPLVSLGFQGFRGVQELQEVFTFPECADPGASEA